jgi:hypothetical protein
MQVVTLRLFEYTCLYRHEYDKYEIIKKLHWK